MKLRVRATELFIHNLRTRIPFRYGIATMTRVPHIFLRLTLELDGRVQTGVAADHLPPKWFTKNPAAPYESDVADMLEVIRHACTAAEAAGEAESVFALWEEIYEAQKIWAVPRAFPALLWSFGVSLVERAIIDAFCRAEKMTFSNALRSDRFGLRLSAIYPELAGKVAAEFLPPAPLSRIGVRHTVGLSDPLTDAEIVERVGDGLPETLEASIREDGIGLLKIKLAGDAERDRLRLREMAAVVGTSCAFTLDGNENYRSVEAFRDSWENIVADAALAAFLAKLIFVEQPIHRDAALSPEAANALLAWTDRPPITIDESDGEIGTLARALEAGYAGGSHKNCKGVFKGIANACLIAHRRLADPAARLHLSAEDLCNVGPVALPQDLAVVASLGIPHAERNGHHYFAGLSQFPRATQQAVLAAHGDLYSTHADGFPKVRIEHGAIDVRSIVAAPFGLAFVPDLSPFTPAAEWSFASLDA